MQGREQTLSFICSRFWIPASCEFVCSVIKHCLYCKRKKAAPVTPSMKKVGVDYLGPYQIKLSKHTRSNQATAKHFIVLFTCLSTRAANPQIAGNLSTYSFILSRRQFLARRRTVKVIRSENGTNFVGASAELEQSIKALRKHLIVKKIDWKFNPPVCPRMGGGHIIRDKLFTAKSLATSIGEIESIIKQRTITPVSDDVNDFGSSDAKSFHECK